MLYGYSKIMAVVISVSHPNTCCDPKYQDCLSPSYHPFCFVKLCLGHLLPESFIVSLSQISLNPKQTHVWWLRSLWALLPRHGWQAHESLCLEFWWFFLQCSLVRLLQTCLFLRFPKSSCTRFHVKICISLF